MWGCSVGLKVVDLIRKVLEFYIIFVIFHDLQIVGMIFDSEG